MTASPRESDFESKLSVELDVSDVLDHAQRFISHWVILW